MTFTLKGVCYKNNRKEGAMISLNVNGKDYKADVPADASLLWVLRDHLKLTGTK
jgi:hypothetical protein